MRKKKEKPVVPGSKYWAEHILEETAPELLEGFDGQKNRNKDV